MPYYYSPFRSRYEKEVQDKSPKPCVLCNVELMESQTLRHHTGTLIENEHYRWVVNWYPRAEAHTMLVPKRHILTISDETEAEVLARHQLLQRCVRILQTTFPDSGIEIFLQTGKGSLGSLEHLHWHLVPTLPQHSLIGFEKIGHFSATKPAEEKVVITPIEITIARESLLQLIADTCKQLEEEI